MNVNSDTQIRQLFFGGIENRYNYHSVFVPFNINLVLTYT
jgi:hypothetical protein